MLIDTRLLPPPVPLGGVLEDVPGLLPRGPFAGLFAAREGGVLVFADGVFPLGVPPRPLLDITASQCIQIDLSLTQFGGGSQFSRSRWL